jgi:hypothetical protein
MACSIARTLDVVAQMGRASFRGEDVRYRSSGEVLGEELAALTASAGRNSRYQQAAALLDELVLGDFQEFLTIPAYPHLLGTSA